MDGIQPYHGQGHGMGMAPSSGHPSYPSQGPGRSTGWGSQVHANANAAVDPTQVKTVGDYFRALKRRSWMVLAIGMPLSILIAFITVKQKNVYRATAEITIDAPQFDKVLSTLVSHEIGNNDSDAGAKYVANRYVMLRSKALAEKVLSDPALTQNQAGGASEEAALDLVSNLSTRQITGSNRFQVWLEGTDAARTARTLFLLLETFQREARDEIWSKNDGSKTNAVTSLNKLNDELKVLDRKINDILSSSKTIGPGGKSIAEERYLTLGSVLMHKRARLGEFQQQAWMASMFPSIRDRSPMEARYEGRIGELERVAQQVHRKARGPEAHGPPLQQRPVGSRDGRQVEGRDG